jgi:hypothetical protein
MASPEARLYAKFTPSTRLKSVIGDLARVRVALQHLDSYDGTNLSDEQITTIMDALMSSPENAVKKLEDFKKRVRDFLRKV